MAFISFVGSKILLALCNFLLLISGLMLLIGGIMLVYDDEKILLSKLLSTDTFPHLVYPLLYYVAYGVILLGLILATAGVVGCWAACLHNYCLVSIYFVLIMVLLIGECVVFSIGWGWPQCIGLSMNTEKLTKTLQKDYGTIGKDQFTAAVDLAQTTFHCCGIDSANEYDTSLWRLQSLGPSLAVPLSCCRLINDKIGEHAYLDPLPLNTSLCQTLEKGIHQNYRHTDGCRVHLEQWYKQHYLIFLGTGLIIVIVEFTVLLSTILTCTRIYHYNQQDSNTKKNSVEEESTENQENAIHYQNQKSMYEEDRGGCSNYSDTYNRREYYKLDKIQTFSI